MELNFSRTPSTHGVLQLCSRSTARSPSRSSPTSTAAPESLRLGGIPTTNRLDYVAAATNKPHLLPLAVEELPVWPSARPAHPVDPVILLDELQRSPPPRVARRPGSSEVRVPRHKQILNFLEYCGAPLTLHLVVQISGFRST